MSNGGIWFEDLPQAGMALDLEIRDILHRGRSSFQFIDVVDTTLFGRTLLLDGIVQTAERDEFMYHEMLVHPAMLSHPNPQRALVIGGGDGGCLRRVLEHPVSQVVMVEIDQEVINTSRRFLSRICGASFEDPRLQLIYTDGVEYTALTDSAFDVILTDAPDPVGPGKSLYSQEFYQNLRRILSPEGILVIQSESPLMMASQTASSFITLSSLFSTVRLCLTMVPSYTGGVWSFILASNGLDPASVDEDVLHERFQERRLETRYYSPQNHRASFTLPKFLTQFLEESIQFGRPSDNHPLFPEAQGITIQEVPL